MTWVVNSRGYSESRLQRFTKLHIAVLLCTVLNWISQLVDVKCRCEIQMTVNWGGINDGRNECQSLNRLLWALKKVPIQITPVEMCCLLHLPVSARIQFNNDTALSVSSELPSVLCKEVITFTSAFGDNVLTSFVCVYMLICLFKYKYNFPVLAVPHGQRYKIIRWSMRRSVFFRWMKRMRSDTTGGETFTSALDAYFHKRNVEMNDMCQTYGMHVPEGKNHRHLGYVNNGWNVWEKQQRTIHKTRKKCQSVERALYKLFNNKRKT